MHPRACSVNVRRIVGKNFMGCKQVKANGILCREDCSMGNLITTPCQQGHSERSAQGCELTEELRALEVMLRQCTAGQPCSGAKKGKTLELLSLKL